MKLSSDTIRQMIIQGVTVYTDDGLPVKKPLLDGFKEMPTLEGGVIDLSVANLYLPSSKWLVPSIYKQQRFLPDAAPFSPSYLETIDTDNGTEDVFGWQLEPGVGYIIETNETLNIPIGVNCRLFPKATAAKSIICVVIGTAHPNFQGRVFFSIVSFHPCGLRLGRDALLVSAELSYFENGDNVNYFGVHGTDKIGAHTNGQFIRPY